MEHVNLTNNFNGIGSAEVAYDWSTSYFYGNETTNQNNGQLDTGLIIGLSIGLPLLALLMAVLYKHRAGLNCRSIQPALTARPGYVHQKDDISTTAEVDQGGNNNTRIDQEWILLSSYSPSYPSIIARRPENLDSKNRFGDVLPFDKNVVVLQNGNYFNASFIEPNFLATQDPIPTQDDDFWPMVWETNVGLIVRLSSDAETEQLPCAVYLPPRVWVLKDLEVAMNEGEHRRMNYVRRTVTLTQTRSKVPSSRTVYHYHLTCWSPQPPSAREFLVIVKDIRQQHQSLLQHESSRVMVHCGAGAGRTGTFIAIWQLLDAIDRDSWEEPLTVVKRLREQRPLMVNSKLLYAFIHECVNTYTTLSTSSPAESPYETVFGAGTADSRWK